VAFAAVVVVPRGAPEMRRSFAFVTHPRVTLAPPIVSSRAQFGIVPAHRHFLFFSFLFFSFLFSAVSFFSGSVQMGVKLTAVRRSQIWVPNF
jgi:hypothetical protein